MLQEELNQAKLLNDLLDDTNCYNEKGSEELLQLLGSAVFDNPKPRGLIEYLSAAASVQDQDVVLDFFAGSGTTGHAVMAQNAADGGNRRYILVQLPEPLDPANEDQKVAADFCDKLGKPRNIAELTKERLRRAAKKIREEIEDRRQKTGGGKEKGTPLPLEGETVASSDSRLLTSDSSLPDLGFRVFKLDSSNIRAWEANRDNLEQSLLDHTEHIKPGRTEQDILYELLLKLGLDLCVPIEEKEVGRQETGGGTHTVYAIGGGVLMACLSERIGRGDVEPLAQGIVAWHKALAPAGDTTCVFRDSAFTDDVAKTNMAAILEQHGIANVRSL
jgi:adenine-specific DNA-methyltransferase